MNIIEAIVDENLFQPFLGDLKTWRSWRIVLRCLYGLPLKSEKARELVFTLSGRSADELPPQGFSTALFLVGRRSGKSRISAVIGAYEALFGGHETRLAKGETGVLPIISPSKYQSSIVWKYLKAIFSVPVLQQEIAEVRESSQSLVLRNGIEVRVLVGDWRTVRGPAVVCAIIDELSFFGYTEESKVKSDLELVRAIKPALMTTKGKLIGISSKYAQRGYAYNTWKKQHGSNREHPDFIPAWRTLVIDAPSRTMNPTLSESEIQKEFEEDAAAARSEFGGEWREDVCEYVSRRTIEALVIPERKELLGSCRYDYRAGCDLSGGRRDSAALVIVHREENKIIQDLAREWKAPFKPTQVVNEMARELVNFGLRSLHGDAYAGEWPKESFGRFGVRYHIADKSKNDLYRELLPILCEGPEAIELLDNPTQTNQLISLERRPRSGGKDVVDHPVNGHDDLSNALAVAVANLSTRTRIAGGIPEMLACGRENLVRIRS
jgi:hypothetical protein